MKHDNDWKQWKLSKTSLIYSEHFKEEDLRFCV